MLLSPVWQSGCFAIPQLSIPASCSSVALDCFSQRRATAPSNKRLKLTGHRALQISVLLSGHETKRFQLPGHLGRQLSRQAVRRRNEVPLQYRISLIVSVLAALGVLPFAWATLSNLLLPQFDGSSTALELLSVVWVISPFVAVTGSALQRRWGLWSLYLALATGVLFGSTLIPYWHKLPARDLREVLLPVINIVAIGIVALVSTRTSGVRRSAA